MAETFIIAETSLIGEFVCIGEKRKVNKELFYQILASKITEAVQKEPLRFYEVMEKAKIHLQKNKSLTVKDTWFEMKGKA